MSLYNDILRDESNLASDIRQDGETWTLTCWQAGREIPGFPSEEMARAVARVIRYAYDLGAEAATYS